MKTISATENSNITSGVSNSWRKIYFQAGQTGKIMVISYTQQLKMVFFVLILSKIGQTQHHY